MGPEGRDLPERERKWLRVVPRRGTSKVGRKVIKTPPVEEKNTQGVVWELAGVKRLIRILSWMWAGR
jgi:hypothetical protein